MRNKLIFNKKILKPFLDWVFSWVFTTTPVLDNHTWMNIYHPLKYLYQINKMTMLSQKDAWGFNDQIFFLTTQSDHSLYIPSVPRYLRTAFSGSRKSFNLPDFDKEGSVWSLSLSLASSLSLTSLPPLPTRYFWTACFRFRFWKIR